jgi:phage gpG-like protein
MQTPTFKGQLIGGQQTIQKWETFAGSLRGELRAKITLLAGDLEALVKRKLSGPVLKVGSRSDDKHKGELRDSINTKIIETSDSIVAVVGTSVSRVPYARIHEFGGTIVPKTAEYLVFKTADGMWHKVKSVTMPQRSYLRSSLADKAPFIKSELEKVLKDTARKAGLRV